jgi:Fe-S cluster assembly iron-binding protein IscA
VLTLTDEAKDVVREMVAAEGGAEGSGLRISADSADDGGELSLTLADEPVEGDAVIDEDGTRVFVEPTAAALLDDKVLDAHRHDDHVHFNLLEQS